MRDYTRWSYRELKLEAKRLEVAIQKDELMLEQLKRRMGEGSFLPRLLKKNTRAAREELLKAVREQMGYRWAAGGLEHPLAQELSRIQHELERRQRAEQYSQIADLINDLKKERK